MFQLWMVWRYLKTGRRLFSLTTVLAILGMVIGVASLVVAMGVISGYQTTLKRSVIDIVGHLVVVKRGAKNQQNPQEIIDEVSSKIKGMQAYSPYVTLDAALAHNKKMAGVIVQGVEPESVGKVLRLESRLVQGAFDFSSSDNIPSALVGKGIAKRFDLKIGDVFKVVMPIGDEFNTESFKPKLQRLRLKGILDIGRHDYDNRYIVTDLKSAQEFGNIGKYVSGFRIKLEDEDQAKVASYRINNELGYPYWTRSWTEVNHNLFEAVRIEKVVIFFVLLIMIIAASFNISTTLFVSVMKRFSDISILRTMGARKTMIVRLFAIQGLVVGFIGTILGFALGICACYGFLYMQNEWSLITGEIYKLDHLDVELRWTDFFIIFGVSMFICFLSTLAPAFRGARLTPSEGLHYE